MANTSENANSIKEEINTFKDTLVGSSPTSLFLVKLSKF